MPEDDRPSVETSAGQDFAWTLPVDRRIGGNRRNRPNVRLILWVVLVGDLAPIIERTAARPAPGGGRHLRRRVDRSLVVRCITEAVGTVFRQRDITARRPAGGAVR